MLEVTGLCAGYAGRAVVRHASIRVPEGKITALLGPNGCGKTTLLKAICGVLPASGGRVLLGGEDVLALPRRQIAQRMAYLAQSRHIPEITVERLVLHGRFAYLRYPRRYRPEDHAAAQAAMEEMDICALAETPLRQLSGGQRQKAYIAMALAQDTPVILLDEPTTFLDVGHQLQLMRQARALAQRGKTVLMIVHDIAQAMRMADGIALMREGCVQMQGTPEEVYASGMLEAVFGVRVGRVHTGGGWQYYCEEK